MKVVLAPDSFKESLSAAEVAAAMAEGVLAAVPDARVDLCPMADGGEGTVEAMVAATNGQYRVADVFGPLGEPRRARFGLLGSPSGAGLPGELGFSAALAGAEGEGRAVERESGLIAVVEMSAASGLALVAPGARDPRRTTTYGTGQLLVAAMDAGARQIVVGIGGSATVDGGCGAAQALGVAFLDAEGHPAVCGLAGGGLKDIARIDISGRDPRLAGTRIRVACDVRNPLTGSNGAAAVYGPQKGATEEIVAELEAGLAHLAELIRQQLGVDVEHMSGAGAAGGLGAGLVAFAGAELVGGAQLVAEAVQLSSRLEGADLCITAEGMLDASSASGKTPVTVAQMASGVSVPTICIPAQAAPDAPTELFCDVRPLVAGEVTVEEALARPAELLRQRTQQAVERFCQMR